MAQDLVETDEREFAPVEEDRAPAPLFQGRTMAARAMAGAVEIESNRAIAEAQAAMAVAQRFHRDETAAAMRMKNASMRLSFAEDAFYSYKRGGQPVEGPTIRMAEELARCWGNMDYGLRELSQAEGYSEMEAYAHDLETNVRSKQQFTVAHKRDVSSGVGTVLTQQRDIYEIGANMGARRMRARILAILPSWYVEEAIARCKATLATKGAEVPLPDRIRRAVSVMAQLGVTEVMLVKHFGHPLDQTNPQELADLNGLHKAIKDGQTTVQEQFPADGESVTAPGTANQPRGRLGATAPAAAKKEAPKEAAKPAAAEAPPKEEAKPPAEEKKPPAEEKPKPEVAKPPAQEKPQEAAKPPAATEPAEPSSDAATEDEEGQGGEEGDVF